MNVLIYSGPGTSKLSVNHCVDAFKLLFFPYYSVSTASERLLKEQPWENKTAILVIPGGADLPICKLFRGEINDRIKNYVNRGGKFIGICSGGYYSSSRCEFEEGNPEMEVSGPRELRFFPGTCRGAVVKGFDYQTESGASVMQVNIDNSILHDAPQSAYLYTNGGGVFVDAHKYSNVKILSTYEGEIAVKDGPEGRQASSVLCNVGRGKALLFGTHPEFNPYLLKDNNSDSKYTNIVNYLKSTNRERIEFFRAALKALEVNVNDKEYYRPQLKPLYLSSANPEDASRLVAEMETEIGYQIDNIMDVGTDKFQIFKSLDKVPPEDPNIFVQDPDAAIKSVVQCTDRLPSKEITPYFDMQDFKRNLIQSYKDYDQELSRDSIGNVFMYSEVLTSTSVLMHANYNLLPLLPSGFAIVGTIQVSGKGRSGNNWLSPRGMLATSTNHLVPIKNAETSPIVFVQYLASMAYIQALLEYDEGYDAIPINIKWPNDIYIKLPEFIGEDVEVGSKKVTHAKVGGILVNTNIVDSNYSLIVGAGLNVSNDAPTTSINSVINAMNQYNQRIGNPKRLEIIKEEKLISKYYAVFNKMFEKFKTQGFTPFLPDYYKYWLHSNQIVKLSGKADAKICGITPDWGMLLARDLKTGEMYQLQPDGNSFDMFNGLISQKR